MVIPKDIVDLILNTHGMLKERLPIIGKVLPLLDKNAIGNKPEEIANFFDKYMIDHFNDEDIMFSILKRDSSLTPDELKIIDGIIAEHALLITKIEKFKSNLKPDDDNKEIKEMIAEIGLNIIELVLNHAKKEDDEVFPIVRRRITAKQLGELERIISSRRA